MEQAQEQHLRRITNNFVLAMRKKYVAGAKKHGNDLLQMTTRQLLEEALEENYDQYVYLVTALEKLE